MSTKNDKAIKLVTNAPTAEEEEQEATLILDAKARALFAKLSKSQAVKLDLDPAHCVSGRGGSRPTGSLPVDAYVDQRSGLVEKALFLRLARERAFPSKRVGKRVVARWGDVQAALSPTAPTSNESTISDKSVDSELDEIRAQVGLAVRGRH